MLIRLLHSYSLRVLLTYATFACTTASATTLTALPGAIRLSAGENHSCAVTSTGMLHCWGRNNAGQLGVGSTVDSLVGVTVSLRGTAFLDVDAGREHTCALTVAGGVVCWGTASRGQFGKGEQPTKLNEPVDVTGLSAGILAVSSGDAHSCALSVAGAMQCWGGGSFGELGNGSTNSSTIPTDVFGLTSGVRRIAAGARHTCALLHNGTMKCWGDDSFGQLGNNSTVQSNLPVDVVGLNGPVREISAGKRHTCALLESGSIRCWGRNLEGELGDGTTTNRLTPVAVSNLNGPASAIATGGFHTCAVLDDGGIQCWGFNSNGQLGDGTRSQRTVPTAVEGLGASVSALAVGDRHTCAALADSTVHCWGHNFYGQVGNNTTTLRLTPTDVQGLSSGVVGIATGNAHSCALTESGGVKCWGCNVFGEGGSFCRSAPLDVEVLLTGVTAIALGNIHSCALTSGGGVKCWGHNERGALGDNTTQNRFVPGDVTGLTSGVRVLGK